MSARKFPKTDRACTYDTKMARREGEALGLVVEALDLCSGSAEQARVIRHAIAILGIRPNTILSVFKED